MARSYPRGTGTSGVTSQSCNIQGEGNQARAADELLGNHGGICCAPSGHCLAADAALVMVCLCHRFTATATPKRSQQQRRFSELSALAACDGIATAIQAGGQNCVLSATAPVRVKEKTAFQFEKCFFCCEDGSAHLPAGCLWPVMKVMLQLLIFSLFALEADFQT